MNRALLISVFVCCACEPPARPARMPPSIPELSVPLAVTPERTTRVSGVSDPSTIVRIYLDETCSGPWLKQVSDEELAAGVEIDLVPNLEAVFAARAFDRSGGSSVCSTPARTRFEPQAPPPAPTLMLDHPSPSATGRFMLTGTAPGAEFVRLFDQSCVGQLLAVLTPEQLATGYYLRARTNGYRYVTAQSENRSGVLSSCGAGIAIQHDSRPPEILKLQLASPNPSSEWRVNVRLVASNDVTYFRVWSEPHCQGFIMDEGTLFNSSGEWALQPSFPDGHWDWSLEAFDALLNSSCRNSEEPRVRDATLPPVEEITFELEARPTQNIRLRIPQQYFYVRIFNRANCAETPLYDQVTTAQAVLRPMFPVRGDVWSVQGAGLGMTGWSKCFGNFTVP